MHYADLSPCDYFGADLRERLAAVGWLERGHEYARGAVEPEFLTKLVELAENPWEPGSFMGPFFCQFCRISRLGGVQNLFVPGEGVVYVSPSLIVHYVDCHEYAPPEVFREAVIACPPMRSMPYLKAIVENGPKGLTASRTSPFA